MPKPLAKSEPFARRMLRRVAITIAAAAALVVLGPRLDIGSVTVFPAEATAAAAPPICEISAPVAGVTAIDVGGSLSFTGRGSTVDGGPLAFEWDFGGGADARIRGTAVDGDVLSATDPVVFDVNGGKFTVRFIVTDDAGVRCTDSRDVVVGILPSRLPAKVKEQPAPGEPGSGDGAHTVVAFNDLGMHCADLGAQPFSILPLFNILNAQVIEKGTTGANRPRVLRPNDGIKLQYSAASNPKDPVAPGSINSTSQNYPVGSSAEEAIIRKTDFWDPVGPGGETVVALLFPGLDPQPDEGLQTVHNRGHGRQMPGISRPYKGNGPKAFSKFEWAFKRFTAEGIPITAIDDLGRPNSYPMMRVQAVDTATKRVLATLDAVVPVSTEVDCRDCHTRGKIGADPKARSVAFVAPASPNRVDVEHAAKQNILLLHDAIHPTDLVGQSPVLCAGCHASPALSGVGGPAGDPNVSTTMSEAMHGYHGRLKVNAGTGALVRDFGGNPDLGPLGAGETPLVRFEDDAGNRVPMEQNCFLCHPGKVTQCFRGAMFTAGRQCADCHGDLEATGGVYDGDFDHTGVLRQRRPWQDEPRCESCHVGDAANPAGGDKPLTIAYNETDPAATPRLADNPRFAEEADTLYRNSRGHGGVACEGCHGSPHAIWPLANPDANDNVAALQLQGHAGTVSECTTCHQPGSFRNGTLGGPHGMHPVNDPLWIKAKSGKWHEDYVRQGGKDQCAACHGADHRGSRLSRVPVDRVLRDEDGVVRARLSAGATVSCGLCHSVAKSFDD
jgi:hypothetical protein